MTAYKETIRHIRPTPQASEWKAGEIPYFADHRDNPVGAESPIPINCKNGISMSNPIPWVSPIRSTPNGNVGPHPRLIEQFSQVFTE